MTTKTWVVAALALGCLSGQAQAEGLFAAIAFSPSTGQAGSAWNYANQADAETEAAVQCASGDCATALVFQQCGALAVGDGFGYGFAAEASLAQAEETAMEYCSGNTSNCTVQQSACNEGY